MKFLELSETFQEIEGISSRNEMIEVLSRLYKGADLDEVQIISYLLLGRVAPVFVNCEFNYSEKSFLNTATRIFGVDTHMLRKKSGDIGDVVEGLVNKKADNSLLSVKDVYEILWKLVNLSGSGSQERKSTVVIHALEKMSALEAKFFARIVCSNLRLGASVKTLLDAFSYSLQSDKGLRSSLDGAYGVCSDVGYIAKAVFSKNAVKSISNISIVPGVPILPRLVERTKSFDELEKRMGDNYYIQPKFDGLRLQIHKSVEGFKKMEEGRVWSTYIVKKEDSMGLFGGSTKGSVRLFTRNLEDVTHMFPEIVEEALGLNCNSCVLDGEIVGWDNAKKTFKSYQDTMTRKRKYSVMTIQKDIPVKVFAFDLLYLNNESLVSKDFVNRKGKLEELLSTDGLENIIATETIESPNREKLEEVFNTWVKMGLEGLIAKLKVGGYTPGGRNFEWVKLKRSFMTDLNDSVDIIVLGYYSGSGKRTSFGIGALLCGVYNDKEDRFESISKLGTGITDDQWKSILDRLEPLIVKECPRNVLISSNLKPDIYVYPEVVCTVEADDITRSVVKEYKNHPAKGFSLRFPRMIEFDRDALPTDITTVDELEDMFDAK